MCDLSISVMCGHKRDREGSLEYDSLAISLVQLINTKSFQMYHIHGYATWLFDPMCEHNIDFSLRMSQDSTLVNESKVKIKWLSVSHETFMQHDKEQMAK